MDFKVPSLPDVVNWAERPLKNGMFERAASNAHVLIHVKHAIEEKTNAALLGELVC